MVISSFFTGGLSAWSKGTMIPRWLGQWEGDLGKDFCCIPQKKLCGFIFLEAGTVFLYLLPDCLLEIEKWRRILSAYGDLGSSKCSQGGEQVSIPSGSFSFLLLDLSSALDWPASLLVPGVRLKLGCVWLVCVLRCANPNSISECFSNLPSSQLPLSPSHSKSGVKGSWGPGSGWCWKTLHAGRAKTGARQGKAGELRNALSGVCRMRSWDMLPKTLQKSKAFSALAWGPGCCWGGITHSALKALFAGGSSWFPFCLFVCFKKEIRPCG